MPDVDLAFNQATMTAGISSQAMAYVSSRYDLFTLQAMFLLLQNAKQNDLPNRATYIEQLQTWYLSVLVYVAEIQSDIAAASSDSGLSMVTWDFSAFTSSDPAVTLVGALLINS